MESWQCEESKSRRTHSMIEEARNRGLAIHVEFLEKADEARESMAAFCAAG